MNSLYQSLNQNQQLQSQNNGKVTLQDIMQEVRQSGMTPQQLFYRKAQQSGANINDILKQAQIMATKFR